MSRSKPSLYLVSVLLFMLILPVVSVLMDSYLHHRPLGWPLVGKWFVFWSVGIRLFVAGIRQASKPEFTAREIFHFSGDESLIVIRELGFANISIGLAGILSLYRADWCQIVAIAGGLFFGLAGLQHLGKKPDSSNELIALISDLYIFVILALFVFFTF
jgi:hypothetical protein